jgi:hypothetical protein
MDKESEGFAYFRQTFSKLSEDKMKGGIFVGPQVTQLFEDQDFSTKLNYTERRAWKAFGNVRRNLPCKDKAEYYSEIRN